MRRNKRKLPQNRVYVGRDLTQGNKNDSVVIKLVVIAVIAIAGVLAWIAYYQAWNGRPGIPEPPTIERVE